MSRKDFLAIAAVIKDQIDRAKDHEGGRDESRHFASVQIAQGFARHAASVNFRFDTKRFYSACGIKF